MDGISTTLLNFKNRNVWVIIFVDSILIIFAYFFSYYLRFDGNIPPAELSNFLSSVLWIAPVKLLVFVLFNLYRGMWRYTGISEMKNLLKACLTSSSLIIVTILLSFHFVGFSRSVFIIDFLLTFILISGYRIGIRLYYNRQNDHKTWFPSFNEQSNTNLKRLLIIGAGDAGEKTLRELMGNLGLAYQVVGFIDDDPNKKGRQIHGVRVLDGLDSLSHLVKKYEVEEVLISVPSATGAQIRRIVKACEKCNVRFKTLPGLGELINGKISVKALRDVDFQDLLRRPAVELDVEIIQKYLKGKRVLVTGAGGSIGSELCRQIVRFFPEKLILIDASETNLYNIQMDLKHQVGYLEYVAILGRVQDRELINQVFLKYKPNVVLHAAAYKHVPMLERNPWEAVYNNIRGTHTVMEQSIRHKAEYFVFVSTDKAVRPTNVMGASKRVCELVLQSFAGNGTRTMAVRFGNVAGSSGSVIPLFRKQIVRGGPVTVTHPEITRYFMTIQEASQLILQAGALGEGGEIFILEMGTPVKIVDMARDLIRLSGKDPDRDIEITYTGLRPGEKLHEELMSEGEGIVGTSHNKILVLRTSQQCNGMEDQATFHKWLMQNIEELYKFAYAHDTCGIKAKLKDIVPEYEVQDCECVL